MAIKSLVIDCEIRNRIYRVRANAPFLLPVVNAALANAPTYPPKILFLRSRSKKSPLVILFLAVLLYFMKKRTKLVSTYLHWEVQYADYDQP